MGLSASEEYKRALERIEETGKVISSWPKWKQNCGSIHLNLETPKEATNA
jgi:hypothetical protein